MCRLLRAYNFVCKLKTIKQQEHTQACYHCGEPCNETIETDNHFFCCNGCSQVYLLLNENGLCNYYDLDKNPGIQAKGRFTGNRFAYLDDESVIQKITQFRSDSQVNVSFSLPQMHCASCIFLLENLHRINEGVIGSRVNFDRKQAFISYDPAVTSLRKVVEMMAFIGYEPAINLQDMEAPAQRSFDRSRIIQLGVAGFCFSNIMMLSFPEYFSGGNMGLNGLQATFTWIIFFLSLPVLFYSASPIFISAWKSLRQGIINIDAPIALASVITFSRSYVEIFTGTGPGYLDSGTGIIFFMLIGRWFQSKTYDAISFDRQYRSYFPLGVTVLRQHKEENIPVTRLKTGDIIIIRNEEMIPADAVLLEGQARVDYSFVSGENDPVTRKSGDIIYAGGKQKGPAIKLSVVKEPSQSYITELWNNNEAGKAKHSESSFIHPWSRYFTLVLFSIAAATAVYWAFVDMSRLWIAVTAVLIVACPCSLLLSATFTFGHMQRIFGRNKLYLKNAGVIETLAAVKHIVFDKTGTITQNGQSAVSYHGSLLTGAEKALVKKAASQSSHPLSQALAVYLPAFAEQEKAVEQFEEITGNGILAVADRHKVQLGSASFIGAAHSGDSSLVKPRVYLRLDESYKGYFEISNQYRPGIQQLVNSLKEKGYRLHLLSGDNNAEKNNLQEIFGEDTPLNFNASPQQKLAYITALQRKGEKVLMIGDGLNDAGALMAADCGIAVSDDAARFSPACDAIIDGQMISRLDALLGFAGWNRRIVMAGFILSVLYNIAGLSFAVQAKLSPLTAAILMPCSSISIMLLAWGLTAAKASRYKLSGKHDEDHVLN